jgi:site-specific DNA-methyltransferase (adenine-specific)
MIEKNKIYCGDNLTLIKQLDDNCIDLTVTSPPYDNLRTYNGFSWDFEGLAQELFRVTKEGGVVVWVVGDATINGSETGTSFKQALYFMECGFNLHDTMIYQKDGIPTNNNRYKPDFEYMFVFSKNTPSKFNPILKKKVCLFTRDKAQRGVDGEFRKRSSNNTDMYCVKNNIWYYKVGMLDGKTQYSGHPGVFPEKLSEDQIISWSNKGDLILDPFMGSGTTAKMALKNERDFIGFEISQEYVDIANKRIEGWKEQTRLF